MSYFQVIQGNFFKLKNGSQTVFPYLSIISNLHLFLLIFFSRYTGLSFPLMSFEFYPNLSTDLSRLLDSADDYNVRMLIGVDGSARTFNAHSVILRARSAYFHAALSKDWAKTEEGSIIFKKDNISPKIFEVILR